ncbi:heparinase II/III family protein [Sphingomonas crusticola]|uniref:heparinase II/III family protein n=1 Tax=Sphingomonas crusticola TaxID=1697973 RepID=UPI000E289298|nr:heparinase II/III family protein [Sphingomonas crusticola]
MTDEPGAGDDDDQGKRQLRAGERPGTSLTEKLGQGIRRLSWRTPVHKLRLRGRYPLQLLDVPADPIPGNAAAGRALLEGRMVAAGESIAFDALGRGGFSPAFADYWQSFAWLRDLAAAADRRTATPVADGLMRQWLAAHARTVSEPAWRPDLWGRRILFWTAYAPILLDTRDAEYRKAVLNALARGARHLDGAADTAPQGLARVTAWAGVIAAGLLFPGGDLRTAHGEAGITRALALAVHSDGGLISRAPVEQLALVELLAQLRGVYEVRARPPSGAVALALANAVPVLASATLGDGALSSWQGGGPAGAARVAAALAAISVRGGTRDDARDWGYQRFCCGQTRLIVDAAPPPAAALARGACASTLAFELSDGPQRLVVNCGGGAGLPAELARGLRTTAAHSTLVLAETNSTALHPDGAMGRGVTEVEMTRSDGAEASRIEAAHDGYVKRFGFSHVRRLSLTADGRALDGEDRLVPAGRKKAASTPLALWFHLAPGIETVLTTDGQGALLRPSTGLGWQFRTRAGALSLEDSLWIDGAGRPRAAKALVVALDTPETGATIPWSFRRVR